MAQQNIYDNETFFEGYKKIRENEVNANNLFEIPALFSMMPDLKDKAVLDLGCGFGEHCKRFVESGAKKVVGIDISEKMLEIAKIEKNLIIPYFLSFVVAGLTTYFALKIFFNSFRLRSARGGEVRQARARGGWQGSYARSVCRIRRTPRHPKDKARLRL